MPVESRTSETGCRGLARVPLASEGAQLESEMYAFWLRSRDTAATRDLARLLKLAFSP